jgi:hypothetical protein
MSFISLIHDIIKGFVKMVGDLGFSFELVKFSKEKITKTLVESISKEVKNQLGLLLKYGND